MPAPPSISPALLNESSKDVYTKKPQSAKPTLTEEWLPSRSRPWIHTLLSTCVTNITATSEQLGTHCGFLSSVVLCITLATRHIADSSRSRHYGNSNSGHIGNSSFFFFLGGGGGETPRGTVFTNAHFVTYRGPTNFWSFLNLPAFLLYEFLSLNHKRGKICTRQRQKRKNPKSEVS